jgi:hypothetical protein
MLLLPFVFVIILTSTKSFAFSKRGSSMWQQEKYSFSLLQHEILPRDHKKPSQENITGFFLEWGHLTQ